MCALREWLGESGRNSAVELQRDGRRITVRVPDEVDLKIEVELGDDNELEVEFTW